MCCLICFMLYINIIYRIRRALHRREANVHTSETSRGRGLLSTLSMRSVVYRWEALKGLIITYSRDWNCSCSHMMQQSARHAKAASHYHLPLAVTVAHHLPARKHLVPTPLAFYMTINILCEQSVECVCVCVSVFGHVWSSIVSIRALFFVDLMEQ